MESPPKLTRGTLIVHHIPLVHCQVPDRQCRSGSKRTSPFGQPGPGLPERDVSQIDSLVYGSLLQAPDTDLAPAQTPEGKESKPRDGVASGGNKRHNPFLLSSGGEAQHLGEGEPGQKSFHLHDGQPAFRLHDANPAGTPWSATGHLDVAEGSEGRLVNRGDAQKGSHMVPESMELDEYSCPAGDLSSFSFEQEWPNDGEDQGAEDHSRTCSCSSSEPQPCPCCSLSSQSEPLDHQMGYVSDSSCNSSDGVLVNFSALYHKMNGHGPPNRNVASQSCDSSSGSQSDPGAFYLDLHSSPTGGCGKACGCHLLAASSPVLDANCNSYPAPCASERSELTACFQSQARLVVATQNYYKLVTCDLSSQSSPSPAGSFGTSCSEEQDTKGSLVQPTEYYLFQRPEAPPPEEHFRETKALEGQLYVNVSPPNLAGGRQRSRSYDRSLDRSPTHQLGSLERMLSCPVKLSDSPALAIPTSPPKRVTSFAEMAKGRKKTGSSPPLRTSRDSSLEFSPIPECQKDGSLFLEDRSPPSQSLPAARSCCLHRSCEGDQDPERGLSHPSRKDLGSGDLPGLPEQPVSSSLMAAGPNPASSHGPRDVRARADGGAADSKVVVRYSKDQRPTTLPIQPFVFQHHFPKQPKTRALHSHFAASLSQRYSLSSASRSASTSQQLSSTSQSSASATSADQPMVGVGTLGHSQRWADGATSLGEAYARKPVPETTRPSPLGSYSPVRSNVPFCQSIDSSSQSPTPESHPPRSRSCPVSANLLPSKPSPAMVGNQAANCDTRQTKESPEAVLAEQNGPQLHGRTLPPLVSSRLSWTKAGGSTEPQWKAGCSETVSAGPSGPVIPRPLNANHLSPQALKWREYRRRNPLGLDRVSGLTGLTSSLDWKQHEGRLPWRNPIFEFPGALNAGRASCRLNGRSVKQLQLHYSDFFPDYFSLAEKPPAEFCLSPDGNTESISVDLRQKKGLVKAVNMAVDLIVAHFGTSRDPGVKAKLGNSSVSPNVGHLVLKYLCPAIRDILSDGLKAYVLDVIVGQRRNIPWSVVEASTQLGPSTKVLNSLYYKVSQYQEFSSHTMRFNAFILGLLNLRSLEFWFNHLYNHEDIVQAHYQAVGFLPLAHSVGQGLFEELLLLLQPLSLLPFDLDLLFEHHLLQMGKEQQQQKELLRVKQDLVLSAHSTLQLMRTRTKDSGSWGAEWDPGQEDGQPAAAEERLRGERRKAGQKDKQASWWYQLMQSSQVYIEGSSKGPYFTRCEQKKTPAAARQSEPRQGPPPREGVVEGAEACPITEVACPGRRVQAETGAESKEKQDPLARAEGPEKTGRPFWMGSPPDSVVTELKRSKEKEGLGQGPKQEKSSCHAPSSSQPKWGHLFGSRKAPKEPKPTNRQPSGWLSLDRSVFQLMAQTVGASIWAGAASEPDGQPSDIPPSRLQQQRWPGKRVSPDSPWEVKALCHHIATDAGQLSFQKGDVLRVMGKVDADWLRCGRGSESGLVALMSVTPVEDAAY